jgi:PKD repeat protein
MATKINLIHKLTVMSIITLFLLVSFAGLNPGLADDKNPELATEHTALIELKSATTCGYCPYQEAALPNLVGDYEYIGLACPTYNGIGYNNDITSRISDLNTGTGYPTSYYDGGFQQVVGGYSGSQGDMQNALNAALARTVADVDLDLMVYWLGDAELEIDLDVTNTGGSTYNGHVIIYICEIESRWTSNDGDPFENALLSLQSDVDISVSSSQTWNTDFVWDGDTYGYGDITSDNIRVIAAVFNQNTEYTDEAIGVMPITNLAPTADFSWLPDFPEVGESVTFSDLSSDPDGSIVGWNWDFGTGDTSTDQNPTYSFSTKGIYTVSLEIEDDYGALATIEKNIIVSDVGEIVHGGNANQDRGFPIRHAADGDWAGAQNFLATGTTITSAEIRLRKFGTPEFDLVVELREGGVEGTLLDTLTFTTAEVPSSWEWLELDFTDTTVTPGNEYFIVCPPAPSGVTTSFGYEWGYAFGNQYDDGSFWFTRDGGNLWRALPTMYEFVFAVYGSS